MTSYWLYKVPPSSRITAFAEYQFIIQFITFMWCILHLCPLLVFLFPNWRVSAFLISPCITTALLPWSFYLPFSGHSLTLLYVSSDAETRVVPSSQVEDAPVLHMDNTTSSVMVGWCPPFCWLFIFFSTWTKNFKESLVMSSGFPFWVITSISELSTQ